MRSRIGRVALGLVITGVLASAGVAHAQTPPTPAPAPSPSPSPDAREEAFARFQRGVSLYDGGDYPAALAEFEAAYKITGRWEVLFNIGVTQKKLFRYGDALHSLDRYLKEGGAQVPPDRRKEVEQAETEIRSLVAEVTVAVEGAPAAIEVDGRAAGTTPLAEPVLVGPGRHAVRASREGEVADERTIDVVSGQKLDVRLAPHPPVKAPTTARLSVRTTPPGGDLAVDGKGVGPAPWTGAVDAGGHELTATLPGRARARQEIVVVGGQDREVDLELPLLPPPAAPAKVWYKRWYVWTAVGVGLVAGGVVVYEETRPSYDVVINFPR